MPILEKQKEVVVAATFRCNWNCPYCAVRNSHDQREGAENDFLERIEKVPDGSNVTITGGEPGLLLHDVLKKACDILRFKCCTLFLETNGTFLRNHPDLIDEFSEIYFHCTVDMEPGENVIDDSFRKYVNVRYLIIVTDDNYLNLPYFLEKHPDIQFDIIAATYPYEKTGPDLSYEHRIRVLMEHGKRMTEESKRRMLKEKDFSSIRYLF